MGLDSPQSRKTTLRYHYNVNNCKPGARIGVMMEGPSSGGPESRNKEGGHEARRVPGQGKEWLSSPPMLGTVTSCGEPGESRGWMSLKNREEVVMSRFARALSFVMVVGSCRGPSSPGDHSHAAERPDATDLDLAGEAADVSYGDPGYSDPHFADLSAYIQGPPQACGVAEANRLLDAGLCPPSDLSVVRPGERIILGGDPSVKSALPRGARCPAGFEYLPKIFQYTPSCEFVPTCTSVVAMRVPEPVIVDGKYLISGLDAPFFVDPAALHESTLSLSAEWGYSHFNPEILSVRWWAFTENQDGCFLWSPRLWPGIIWGGHRYIVNGSQPGMEAELYPETVVLCAARNGPVLSAQDREVVTQYGSFAQYVHLPNFKGRKNCNILIKTYCCGPILMLEPEDVAELFEDPSLCAEDYEEPTYLIVTARSMSEAGLDDLDPIYDWFQTKTPAEVGSCANAISCASCASNVCLVDPETTGSTYEVCNVPDASCSHGPMCSYDINDYSSEKKPDVWKQLQDRASIQGYRLDLDEVGHPSLLWPVLCTREARQDGTTRIECKDAPYLFFGAPLPYRTPEELAAEIPSYRPSSP